MEKNGFDIQEELKKLPGKPGVYIMHDETDAIIYVGKAISRMVFFPEKSNIFMASSKLPTSMAAKVFTLIGFLTFLTGNQ